jgi:hypothetical protein
MQEAEIPEMKRPMAKKTKKPRPWTREDIRVLKTLAREVKTSLIAIKLKRTVRATQQKASMLDVRLGTSKRKRKA